MDITPYIGAIVTGLVFVVGSYFAQKNANDEKFSGLSVQIAALTTKVDDLKDQVEKHNGVIERTYSVERDMKTAFRCIDELRERDDKIEAKIEKLHE